MESKKLSNDKGWIISYDNKQMNQMNGPEERKEKNLGNIQNQVNM